METYCNILITGQVQDVGFRVLVEELARVYGLQGFVFNDVDGSVKIVCGGDNGLIAEFLDELQVRGAQSAVIDSLIRENIPSRVYLPQKFFRLHTDELSDISRKLDIGNSELKNININLLSADRTLTNVDNRLTSMDDKLTSMDDKLTSMDDKLTSMDGSLSGIHDGIETLTTTMSSFTETQKEHNRRLMQVLEKLSE